MKSKHLLDAATVQLGVQDIRAALEFYSKLIGRAPDFAPHEDFVEWEIFPGFWLQLAQSKAQPGQPIRFRVKNIEEEIKRIKNELNVSTSKIIRIPGLVAFCNFQDPWGNNLGFYQRLFDRQPRVPGGSFHDFET